jgi:hypothetical protein
MISLWLCGPAYLAAFANVVSHPSVNPYKVDQDHPPYAVRAQALMTAAPDLGFGPYGDELHTLVRSWRESKWDQQRDNRFLRLANDQLLKECIRCSFAFCKQTGLRKCSPEDVNRVRERVAAKNAERAQNDELGADTLLEAWLVHRELGDGPPYEEWALQRVGGLAELVRQLCR